MFPYAYYLNLAGWYHLALFGVLLPLSAIRSRRKITDARAPLPERVKYFRSTSLTLVILGGLSLLIARKSALELFPATLPRWQTLVAAVASYAAAVALMNPRWRRAVERRDRVVHLFMPANGRERAWWIAVAVLAGFFEEITWRGVQAGLLAALTGSFWTAAVLASISFGAAHMVQGWRQAAIIGGLALGFHALVWLDGSLYLAMAVHIAYDITAGLRYGQLGRELGYQQPSG